MRVVGIIAEYNPLHNGHIYHLEQAKELSKADYCVVVLSGNFVQRGEAACTDKFTRATWALKAGADLVLELPSVYAVAPAERFATGGVRTLGATGVVTDLAFGCEAPDLQLLYQISDVIASEPPALQEAIRKHLSMGKSYPRARFDALTEYGVPKNMLNAIAQPNNILAVEYLRAIRQFADGIEPLPITRIGTGYHSEDIVGEYASATAIRKAIINGRTEILSTMPSFVGGPLMYDDQFIIAQESLSDMMLYAIRRLSAAELANVPDVCEGFENVLYRAVREVRTLNEFFDAIKTKRYTLARCKRIAVCALLGITTEQVKQISASREGTYLRVLGFQRKARPLLGEIAKRKTAPFLLRNSDLEDCPAFVRRNVETDSLSTDILSYATTQEIKRDLSGAVVL
ncbi:MAG: nucleotidyltransferase family protein [Eubacteriales bacterium]|nr:nucleotidyltransferase family protein [Eubacteriales bacterium]